MPGMFVIWYAVAEGLIRNSSLTDSHEIDEFVPAITFDLQYGMYWGHGTKCGVFDSCDFALNRAGTGGGSLTGI